MESFLVWLVSASLFGTWVSSTQVGQLQPCSEADRFALSAAQNAATIDSAPLAPFGRPETGWQIYEAQVAATIGTTCAAQSKRFAASVARWQSQHRLPATGTVGPATLAAMKQAWQKARPFIAAFAEGDCPEAAAAEELADIGPREGWLGKETQLHAQALAALRRMVAAARAADPRIAADPQMLTIVSAFRSPEYDAAKCAGGRCNGIAKARCSAHRTGTAVDLYVGAAPGHSPVGSDDENRLFQSRTPTYRWLVKNAAQFGFVNYVFEPWHWEWVGAPAQQSASYDRRSVSAHGIMR
ncbi:MAG: D-alanyl-D-alanine carboxypeptidase family protein [Alphaproteobacteria bacterium]|nr:D-alanyl-D-alanine carboxypeptidase family protein [Alphaproteobacteria bacterium]